jgi:hypothetical protein
VTGPGLYAWVPRSMRMNRFLRVVNVVVGAGSAVGLWISLTDGDLVVTVLFAIGAGSGLYGCVRCTRHNRWLADRYKLRTGRPVPARWTDFGATS